MSDSGEQEMIDSLGTAPEQDVESDEEEEEITIDWAPRLRRDKQKPSRDLSHFVPNGQIAINAANVRRFNDKCTSILTNPKAFADQQIPHSDGN
ncbi:hypothetical protein FVEG_16228 [Fusarium verticillioides 7600]|uniref:Uncharacterized protein n=1 Tax=Gibberella moniliformis (strain M3125 / FGSC 7600) TaxID=334819 RepID=W7MAH5_GIBM7|nr:hypothetical protein FVEG_16228 [Fusarium verticillioides 7600]EWG48006.1 hypothetical protein FVEG_16228 [Fusarium verticillioides 7600]